MIFFTSNLFFDNIEVSENRHFKSVGDMNNLLIKNWNSYVVDSDKVYILGNVGNFDYLKELNGEKVLILSDSDIKFFNKYVESISSERDDCYDREMFEIYCEAQYGVDHVIFTKKIIVNTFTNLLVRLTVNGVDISKDMFNIYGSFGNYKKLDRNTINSDTSVNGYFPISEFEVNSMVKSLM